MHGRRQPATGRASIVHEARLDRCWLTRIELKSRDAVGHSRCRAAGASCCRWMAVDTNVPGLGVLPDGDNRRRRAVCLPAFYEKETLPAAFECLGDMPGRMTWVSARCHGRRDFAGWPRTTKLARDSGRHAFVCLTFNSPLGAFGKSA